MNDRFEKRAKTINSLLCVGLDSDFEKLPERFKELEFPQLEFNKWIIGETHEFAATYKLNSAFYEARGADGIKELKMTMEYLGVTHPEVFTILDAKRADIGNTNIGYVRSIFDWLGFDAVTLHPYLGKEALLPFLERADKVSIILCKTSNPGSGEFQDLVIDDVPLWKHIAQTVADEWNEHSNCMLVVGATYPENMRQIREVVGDMTFLVPGTRTQGGSVKEIASNGLNSKKGGLIINSSRGIIFSQNPKEEARKLRDEIRAYTA